jgi:prepilin-type N-terminal cleavage/methylation domain-containing protein
MTLVEIMIVIAIISIMAMIGGPNMLSMMHRSKRTEAITVASGIYTAQRAYESRWDAFVDAPTYHPRESLTRYKVAWEHSGDLSETLGYQPDGLVYGKYMTSTEGQRAFTIKGEVDVDGDQENAVYEIIFDEDRDTPKSQGWMSSDMTF